MYLCDDQNERMHRIHTPDPTTHFKQDIPPCWRPRLAADKNGRLGTPSTSSEAAQALMPTQDTTGRQTQARGVACSIFNHIETAYAHLYPAHVAHRHHHTYEPKMITFLPLITSRILLLFAPPSCRGKGEGALLLLITYRRIDPKGGHVNIHTHSYTHTTTRPHARMNNVDASIFNHKSLYSAQYVSDVGEEGFGGGGGEGL